MSPIGFGVKSPVSSEGSSTASRTSSVSILHLPYLPDLANMGQGIGVGFERAMDEVAEDMQNAIPTSFDTPGINMGDVTGSHGGLAVSGMPSLINIQQMIVRSEDDIRKNITGTL